MPVKNLFYRFQPAPLYIVLILSICYFSVQLILSHLTHALTLLMASYHMLCNIFALAGSIVTIKHNELHNGQELHHHSSLLIDEEKKKTKAAAAVLNSKTEYPTNAVQIPTGDSASIASQAYKTHNTFGWARIEILTMLIVCITLASLSFSLMVEALQTLVHIDHQDSMHLPVHVMILGFVGLLLNGFTYFVIGGYTLHQGSFLRINNANGKVIIEPSNITVDTADKVLTLQTNAKNDHQLKEELKTELGKVHYRTRREGPAELLRDVSSTIFVIVCAVIVHFAQDKEHTAKFIDPVLSIFSCTLVVGLSYPYMKEACLILLQTIPGNIDMEDFQTNLVKKFPQIVSYHDLHIWQLSAHKYIATVHIIFQDSKMYAKTIDEVRTHFHDHQIAHVTIQPEFYDQRDNVSTSSVECLVQCTHNECLDKVCCKDSMTDLREISVCPGATQSEHGHNHKKHCSHDDRGHSHHAHNKHGHSHSHKHSHKHAHGHSHGHGHGKHELSHKHTKDVANNKQTETEKVPNNSHVTDDDRVALPDSNHIVKDAVNDKALEAANNPVSIVKHTEEMSIITSNMPEKTEIFNSSETTAQPLNNATTTDDDN